MKHTNWVRSIMSLAVVAGAPAFPSTLHGAHEMTATHPAQQQSHTTRWKGTLDAGGTRLRLEIDITRSGDVVSGTLRSLDQNNAILDLAEVRAEGDTLSFAIPAIGARYVGAYRPDRMEVEGTFVQGGARMPLTLEQSDGTEPASAGEPEEQLLDAWVGELAMGGVRPIMQFRVVVHPAGDTVAFFDSVTEGRTGFPATWSLEGDSLKFDVAAISLTYRGVLNASRDSAEGIWSQGGRAIPLVLERQAGVHESPNVWENRPQRPVAPFPYDAEDVTFENTIDGVTLAGTLTIPRTSGRSPVAVLISGSGSQDRDETLMGHKPFLVLADYLSRRGIAVLRYDDRGTAGSTGNFAAATTEDFARDAAAGVEFLRHHDRINPDEVGLIGHSEGGLVAPMVVGLRDDVAFVVLMGATGVEGATIMTSQTEAILRAGGADEAEIEVAQAVNRAVTDLAMSSAPGADLSADLDSVLAPIIQTLPESDRDEAAAVILQAVRNTLPRLQSRWMRFFLSYDPRPALRNIACPVLAITGSKDVQVLPDLNLPEIETALREGGNQDYEVIELEGLNHMFQTSATGSVGEYASIAETFNPVALETIRSWIARRTTISAAATGRP